MTTKTKHRTGAAETINPDHIRMHRLIVGGVTLTLLAAVLTSWNGLNYVGRLQLLGWFAWLTPLMVDVPLIVLTLARGALRKRGIATPGFLRGIIALSAFSSVANFLHTTSENGVFDLLFARQWGEAIPLALGALTNALAPWIILGMTEVLWIVVTRPIKPKVLRSTRRAAKAPRTPRAPRAPRPAPAEELPPAMFDVDPEPDMLAALRETAPPA